MKKKLLISLLIAALVVCSLTVGILATDSAAEGTEEITFRIAAQSLTLSDSVRINFKVEVPESADVSTLRLLVWEGVPTDENGNVSYTKDATYTDFVTEDGKKVQDANAAETDVYLTEKKNAVTLSVLKTEAADTTSTGNARYVFQYSGIAAAEFGKTVYACAYYEAGGTPVYTAPIRYSVAEYIYNKQTTEDENFAALLNSLVVYGNASSVYFAAQGEPTGPSIPTVVIENDGVSTTTNTVDMHTVTLTDGTFADGFSTGKFLAGESAAVTLSVPEGYTFYGWKKGETFTASTESSIPVTEDATYTPVYGTTGLAIENGTVTGYTGTATEVVIPNGVTAIGANAFKSCTGLTSVTIPDSVTSIGNYAFKSCTGLTSVTIPASVTSIGDYAFSYCTALESIEIPASVESIGNYAFEYCTALTSVTFAADSKLTSIGNNAFRGCTKLTSVTIPNGVTAIGIYAFQNCTKLTSVTIPASVTSIGEYAFRDCTALTNVTISEGVASIGKYAFGGCISLTSITIPASVTSIGAFAFEYCTALTSVTITEGVTSIGNFAFSDCDVLKSIEIPKSVTAIGKGVFSYCDALESVTFAEGSQFTSIAEQMFYQCTKLESIIIPDSVTSIGLNAFEGCTALTSVTIPTSVTSIGNRVFYGCTTTINYAGTEEEWSAITKGTDAIPTGVTVNYN